MVEEGRARATVTSVGAVATAGLALRGRGEGLWFKGGLGVVLCLRTRGHCVAAMCCGVLLVQCDGMG